jgi:hypothetical protein
MPREMMIRLSLGEADVLMMAEGVSYNPDIADDMVKKAQESLQKAVKLAVEVGIPVPDDTKSEDDDACGCEEDCENCDGFCDDCECEQPDELTDREFIEKLLKGLTDGD